MAPILFNVIQAASTGQSQALEAAGIPLVSLAVPVEGYPFITNDDAANGVQAGEALGEAFKASGIAAGVALIGRFDDQDSTKQRMDGVIQGLKNTAPERDHPGVRDQGRRPDDAVGDGRPPPEGPGRLRPS